VGVATMFRWSSRKTASAAMQPLAGNAAMGVAAVVRGADEMAASMPATGELDEQFGALLDALAVSGDARTKMLAMEPKLKWQMICTQQRNVGGGGWGGDQRGCGRGGCAQPP
jgi:hypothetical protein